QRPCRAFGTQAQVNSKERAGRIGCRKRLENLVTQSIKKLVIRNVWRKLAFLAVKEKQVNIRAVIQFTSTEFSECKDGKIRFWRAVPLTKFRVPVFEDATDANLRDLREFARCFFQRGDSGKFTQRQACHLPPLPKPQSRELCAGRRLPDQSVQL